MKNKLFFWGMVVLAISLVFMGCTEFPEAYKLEPTSVPGPKNLVADTSYDGIVILKWDPVIEVSSYQVIRLDTEDKRSVVLGTTSANYYRDAVGNYNLLVNDRKYEYTVVSLATQESIVQNGSSKVNNVQPKIPATFTPALAAADVKVEATDKGGILVTLPNKPNQKYEVSYSYELDTGALGETFSIKNPSVENVYSNPAWFIPNITTWFPAFGGVNAISVTAAYVGSANYGDYYYGDTFQVTVDTPAVPVVYDLQVTDFYATDYTLGRVSLVWRDIEAATAYNIYRAPVANGTASDWNNYSYGGGIDVTGNWTEVTAVQTKTSALQWQAVDVVADDDATYLYVIVAENAGGKGQPSFAVLQPAYTAVVSLNVSYFNAYRTSGKVTFGWSDNKAAVSYTISKAPVEAGSSIPSNNADPNVTGAWTVVDAVQKKDDAYNWSADEYLSSDSGTYLYKIVAQNAAGDEGNPRYYIVDPLLPTFYGSITWDKDSDGKVVNAKWTADTSATYTLEYAEVKSTTPGQEADQYNYELVGAYTNIPVAAANYVQGQAVIPHSPAVNKNYIYKLTYTKNDVTSIPYYEFLTSGAYSTVVGFQLDRSYNQHYNQNANANSIAVQVSRNGAYNGRDYTIKLFRRITTSGQETPFTELTIPASQTTFSKGESSWTFVDTVSDITLGYAYKAVADGYIVPDWVGANTSSSLQAYGYDVAQYLSYTFYSSWIGTPNNTATAVANWQGNATLPARSVALRYGTLSTDGYYSNYGPNIDGLSINVEYTPVGGTQTKIPLAISRIADTSNVATLKTTTYYYIITLPNLAQVGTDLILVDDDNIVIQTFGTF